MNAAGLDLLKHYEGFRADAYLDPVGIPTIGFGFVSGVKLGDHMTMEQAIVRLNQELAPREAVIHALSTPATDNQHAAMTCFAYNVGMEAFKNSTLLKLHRAGDFGGTADQFLRWDKAAGRVLPGLVRRRAAERTLYLTPNFPNDELADFRGETNEAHMREYDRLLNRK
jgi:lysozyme